MEAPQEIVDNRVSIRYYLSVLRKKAGLTQAQVAERMTVSPARVSRLEADDQEVGSEELQAFLTALRSPDADAFKGYLNETWRELERPAFDHPDLSVLRLAEQTLRELVDFYNDPTLKHVFKKQVEAYEKELRRYARYLTPREHLVAMIGSIGVGKTTAICSMTGLQLRAKDPKSAEPALEVGGGGITICEMHLKRGPQYGLIVEPLRDDHVRAYVADFCEYITKLTNGLPSDDERDTLDSLGLSKEIVRAIRNMAKLTTKRKSDPDPAKELATRVGNIKEMIVEVLARMELHRRDRHDTWYSPDLVKEPLQWLHETFLAVNNGRHPEFPLPRRIDIIVPGPILGTEQFNVRIVDTKGVDQTAERADLEQHFDDPQTVVILCSRFNDAPEHLTQELLRRAREARVPNLTQKAGILVLPRPDEALAMKYDDGTRIDSDEEGYDLKRDQIEMRLRQWGADSMGSAFFNALLDDPFRARSFIIERISGLRSVYRTRIGELVETVRELIEHHGDLQVQAIIQDAAKRLRTWLANNRQLDPIPIDTHVPLLLAIQRSHPSTIRATVRRKGAWHNLDYSHHLGFGARTVAANSVGKRVEGFQAIANNIVQDPEMSHAHNFARETGKLLESATDAFLKKIQILGQSAYDTDLQGDANFWQDCMDDWGSGYRPRISDRNRNWFTDATHQQPANLIEQVIRDGWADITSDIEKTLPVSARDRDNIAEAASPPAGPRLVGAAADGACSG